MLATLIERVRTDEGQISPGWTREEVAVEGGGDSSSSCVNPGLPSAIEKVKVGKTSEIWGSRTLGSEDVRVHLKLSGKMDR